MIPGTRYRVLRQLARSARGIVYQVEHLELGRRFLLELLRAELTQSPELVRRTRADWQALSRLRHPNIVRVTDAGLTTRGLAFCVTEQLRGATLRQHLQRRRSLAVPDALRIARELATALSSAHAIGVVHCNVQPEQVFLVSGGAARLLAFGPTEADGKPEPSRGRRPRSRWYLAPELARGAPADWRSDVYGVGLVLFEMVAGRPALAVSRRRRGSAGAGRGDRAGQDALAGRGCPPRLARAVPGVSQALSELVARLLAHEPGARPSLAEAIGELAALELRYQSQISTTQATAHYVTRRLPFLVDSGWGASTSEVIVPLPSQTLAGIPWTVTDARAGAGVTHAGVELPGEPPSSPIPKTPSALPPKEPALAGSLGGDRDRKLDDAAHPPKRRAAWRRYPTTRRRGRGLTLRLVFVMGCSLLAGVLVASWARRSLAGEARLPAARAAAERSHSGARRTAASSGSATLARAQRASGFSFDGNCGSVAPSRSPCWIDCSSVSVPSPRTSSCSEWATSACRSRWSLPAPVIE